MILDAIFQFIVDCLNFFVDLIPDMKIEVSPQNVESFNSVISNVAVFVPVGHVALILGIIITVYIAEFAWLVINWLIAKIPTIN